MPAELAEGSALLNGGRRRRERRLSCTTRANRPTLVALPAAPRMPTRFVLSDSALMSPVCDVILLTPEVRCVGDYCTLEICGSLGTTYDVVVEELRACARARSRVHVSGSDERGFASFDLVLTAVHKLRVEGTLISDVERHR